MEILTPRLVKIHEIQLTLKFLLESSLLFVTRNTHMCGFWTPVGLGFRVNLAVDLKGGFAKFNFSALRLPKK